MISIQQIEVAINRCTKEQPPQGYAISHDSRRLADVYGTMIFRGLSEIDPSALNQYGLNQEKCGPVLEQWVVPV